MPTMLDGGEILHPITVDAFERMLETDILDWDEYRGLELLEGVIVTMPQESPDHMFMAGDLVRFLHEQLDLDRFFIAVSNPLTMSTLSQPKPDVYVTERSDLTRAHVPTASLLAIEVSVTTLRRDLSRKARIYADGGVPDYWVIDPAREVVHVHRGPVDGEYASVTQVRPPTVLEPVTAGLPSLDLGWLFADRYPSA